MTITRRTAYVIASSAPPVLQLADLLTHLDGAGWTSCVITTPTVATWIDLSALAKHTPWPIRVQPRLPHEKDSLPEADAVLAVPLTFNTLNKWAAGISDTLALGILNEAIGLDAPIIAAPMIKSALRQHPAYGSSIATLQGCGVHFLDPDRTTVRPPEGLVSLDWPQVIAKLEEVCPAS